MVRSAILLLIFFANTPSVRCQDLFRLAKDKHWSEELTWSDSASIAVEEFFYNEPRKVDEERSHVVYIKFFKPTAELVGSTITLPRDSDLVDVRYHLSSVWFWADPKPVRAKGEIRVIATSSDGVTLDHDFNFTTNDREDGRFRLVGLKTIRKGRLGWFRRSYLW
jgi:hypothetical protein